MMLKLMPKLQLYLKNLKKNNKLVKHSRKFMKKRKLLRNLKWSNINNNKLLKDKPKKMKTMLELELNKQKKLNIKKKWLNKLQKPKNKEKIKEFYTTSK